MSRYFVLSALLMAALFSLYFVRRSGERPGSARVLYFFLLVFSLSLGGQLWISPLGPVLWHLDAVLLLCLSLVFFISAQAFSRPDSFLKPVPDKEKGLLIGLFFWFVLLLLIVSVVLGLRGPAF